MIHHERDAAVVGIVAALFVGQQQRNGFGLGHVVPDHRVEVLEAGLEFGEDHALDALALRATGRKKDIHTHLIRRVLRRCGTDAHRQKQRRSE